MREVTVKKDELRVKVLANREQHQAIFEEAVEGYKTEAVKQLEEHIARIKAGGLIKVFVQLPMPENHIHDYDRVLEMIEWEVEDEITLDEDSFASFVMDDWSWKRQFIASNAAYSVTAAKLS